VPFGLICFTVVTLWYALHGHAPDDVVDHRTRARWYTTTTEPCYDDMAVKLRRVIVAARFRNPCPEQATSQETPERDQQKLRNTRAPVRRRGRVAPSVCGSGSGHADVGPLVKPPGRTRSPHFGSDPG
jgi:hypothetical protein